MPTNAQNIGFFYCLKCLQNYGVKAERQKFKGMENSEIIKSHSIPQFKGMENNEIIKKHSISQFKGNGK